MYTGGRPARKNRRPYTAAGQAMPAGASREGLSRTTRDNTTRGPPAGGGYDAARSLIERANARMGGKGNPHRGSAFAAGPRPRAGSPVEGRNPSRVPGSSGRWPLAQEQRAAQAHARPQWQPPSARGGGISTWLVAPSRRERQEAASAALLQVPPEPPERVEREQRWLRWRGVARDARSARAAAVKHVNEAARITALAHHGSRESHILHFRILFHAIGRFRR